MREGIQQLIAEGHTEEALALLVKHNSDVVLLQARYNQAKKQQNIGLIDFGEWSRVVSQTNYAALEMAGNIKISGSNNVVISNVSDSQIIINTKVQNNVKVTINFSSVDTFKESINRLDLPTLISLATSEFKGKEAMKAWLPIKQEYDSYELLGTPFVPGYLTMVKEKLVAIYDEFWTKISDKQKTKVKSAVKAIYNSLISGKTEDIIRICIDDLMVFFYENEDYNHHNYAVDQCEEYVQVLDSPKLKLFKQKRPESYTEELERIHSELVAISNKILLNLEQ